MIVYAIAIIFSIMMVLPLSPFVYRAHYGLAIILGLFFVISALYNLFAFPFSPSAPFKVHFKQTLDIENNNSTVYLGGVRLFLEHPIVDSIPSSHFNKVTCNEDFVRLPIWSCHWTGALPNLTLSSNQKPFSFAVERLANSSTTDTEAIARFTIKGVNTRACRIYFDRSIEYVRVHGASHDGSLQPGYEYEPDPEGTTTIKLWSRTWDPKFVVDVGLGKSSSNQPRTRTGRVACEYSENLDGRIPALEEIGLFLPGWAVVTKQDDGLVEAYHNFKL